MNATECRKCNSTDLDTNDTTAELFCRSCGFIMEQSQMVENLSFVASASGAKTTAGQMVGMSAGLNAALGTGAGVGREGVLQRGFQGIQHVADSLRLSNQLVEGAQRMYALALNARLTAGRRRDRVAVACLYTMCRRDKRPFLLIDFADALEIPVKRLGQTFMQLCRGLHIKEIPSVDPSLFMDRFTQQIPMIADKGMHREVAFSAIKVVQSMKRDWLCTGRRPNGIIGAALLVACRIHGFKINPEDLAHMCRISPATINFRLKEFRTTALALLQAEEFHGIDVDELPQQRFPPALMRHRRLGALQMAGMSTQRAAIESLYSRAQNCIDEEKPDISACISRWGLLVLQNDDAAYAEEFKTIEDGSKCPEDDMQDVVEDDFNAMFRLDDDEGADSMFALGNEYDETTTQEEGLAIVAADTLTTASSGGDIWGGLLAGENARDDDLFGNIDEWNAEEDPWALDEDKEDDNVLATEDENTMESDLGSCDSDEFDCMLLSKQESRAKSLLWDELTKDVLPGLYRRRFERQIRNECRIEISDRASRHIKASEAEQFFDNMSGNDKGHYLDLF